MGLHRKLSKVLRGARLSEDQAEELIELFSADARARVTKAKHVDSTEESDEAESAEETEVAE